MTLSALLLLLPPPGSLPAAGSSHRYSPWKPGPQHQLIGLIQLKAVLTPVLTLEAGATISFYTAAVKGTTFANDLQVYISLSGSSTNVGSDAQTPTGGVFSLLPGGDLNPTLAVNGYPDTPPNGWTLEAFTLTKVTERLAS